MTRAKAERITIRPRTVAGLDWVRCGFDSALGHIESDWERMNGVTTLTVTVPAGAQATVVLPGSSRIVGEGQHRFIVRSGPA